MSIFLGSVTIIERNDAPVRRAEGLELRTGVLQGAAPSAPIEIEVAGLQSSRSIFCTDRRPGFYLDQAAELRDRGASIAKGRRVLDCFTNQGAFALACARAGAAEVTAVEESSESLAAAKQNARAERTADVRWIEAGRVCSFCAAPKKQEREYDLIILDPPSFTKTKSGLRDALRGYRELHVRAFKLLSKDGLLATFSCSHHVSEAAFSQTIADALVDARRSARRLRRFEQALDHPVLPTIPETEYFKGVLLEMMPGR